MRLKNKKVYVMSDNPASNKGNLRKSEKETMPGNSIKTYRGLKSRFYKETYRYQVDRGIERISKLPYCIFRVNAEIRGIERQIPDYDCRSDCRMRHTVK